MSKTAVIGSEYIFEPFKALGIEVLKADTPLKAREVLKEALPKKLYSIIFITEELAEESMDLINEWNKNSRGVVILIPGTKGSTGIAGERMSLLTKSAIGAEVLVRK